MANLVVLRPLGLGDFLTAVPAYRALADAFPDHRLLLAAPAALAPLFRLVPVTSGGARLVDTAPLRPLPPPLVGADLAVDLHGKGPQSHRVLLDSGPRRLIAFSHGAVPESAGGPTWRPDEHEVHRWCRLLEESGVVADPGRLDLVPPGPPPGLAGATVVHPGAASAARVSARSTTSQSTS